MRAPPNTPPRPGRCRSVVVAACAVAARPPRRAAARRIAGCQCRSARRGGRGRGGGVSCSAQEPTAAARRDEEPGLSKVPADHGSLTRSNTASPPLQWHAQDTSLIASLSGTSELKQKRRALHALRTVTSDGISLLDKQHRGLGGLAEERIGDARELSLDGLRALLHERPQAEYLHLPARTKVVSGTLCTPRILSCSTSRKGTSGVLWSSQESKAAHANEPEIAGGTDHHRVLGVGTHIKEVGVEQVRNAQFQAEIAPRRDVHLRLHHDRVGRFVEVLCGRARACAYACARVHVACICTLTVYAMSAPYSGSCATYLRPRTTESTQSIV